MSTSYSLVCAACKVRIHAGQCTAGGRFISASGSNDVSGQQEVGDFIYKHQHQEPLYFINTDHVPDSYVNMSSP